MFPRGIVVSNFWSSVFLKRDVVKFYGQMLASYNVVLLKFFEFLWFVSARILNSLVRVGSAILIMFIVFFSSVWSVVYGVLFLNVLERFYGSQGPFFQFLSQNGDCKKGFLKWLWRQKFKRLISQVWKVLWSRLQIFEFFENWDFRRFLVLK